MPGEPAWLTIDTEGERRHVRLDLQLTTIGRNEANVIDLPDKRLSRFHCEILRQGEDYVLRDCGSRNGTKLNGQRVAADIVLAAGDTIELGGSTLHFRTDRPIDADPGNNLVPIAPIPRSVRKATTMRAVDMSGQTPDEPFDPRPTIPLPPAIPTPPPSPPPPPPPPRTGWRALGAAIARLAEVASSEQVLARLAQTALELVPARQALVLLPGGAGAAPRVAAMRPLAAPDAAADARYSSAVVDAVLTTQRPVSVQDLKQDERWSVDYSVLGLDLRGVIAVPLRAVGRVRGVLYVDEPRVVVAPDREEAIALLAALAEVGAGALVATGGAIAVDEERAATDAARAAQLATEALPPASGVGLAVKIRPGGGAFAEVQTLREHAGRREIGVLVAVASGSPLDAVRLEVAARAAFRALARSVPRADALLAALADALGQELEGSALRAAVLRIDPLSGDLHVASAALGPLVHRGRDGQVLALDATAPPIAAGKPLDVSETAVAWERGDLCLLATPAPSDLAIAPWLAASPGPDAKTALERAASELPDAAALVVLSRV